MINKRRRYGSAFAVMVVLVILLISSFDFKPWKKYEGNPVVGNEETGTCFDVDVLKIGDVYRMYFSWRKEGVIAVCESKDGKNWSDFKVVLDYNEASGWENIVNRISVVYRDGTYHMWYTGQTDKESYIGYAVSDDGYNFSRIQEEPVLVPAEEWEGVSVMNPSVMWDEEEGIYKMWYAGGEKSEPDSLGYATSENGKEWTKYNQNPIMSKNEDNWYEQVKVGGCHVIKTEEYGFLMFYIGYEDAKTARICVAKSEDGITDWKESRDNPIVEPDGNTWDEDSCYKPSALWNEEEEQWMLWYNGRRKAEEYIGLVIHEGYDLNFE